MKNEIFHIGEMPFPEWLKKHTNNRSITLIGQLPTNRLTEFDCLRHLTGTVLDISQLTIDFHRQYREQAVTQAETDLIWEYYYQHCCEQDNTTIPLILTLCDNRHLAQRFLVTDKYILSEDKQSIAFFINPQRILTVEDGIMHIGNYACMGQETLQILNLPESLKTIGNKAFEKCSNLTQINFPPVMTSLGEDSFAETNISQVRLPEGITDIPCGLFYYCILFDFNIPSTVKTIGEAGLGERMVIDEITIPEGVEEIQTQTFFGVHKIHLPSTLKKLDEYFYCEYQVEGEQQVPYITIHPDNPCFYAENGTIYRRGETKPYTPFPFSKWWNDDEQ